MNLPFKCSIIVLLFFFILNSTVATNSKGFQVIASADSFRTDHQEINNDNATWEHIKVDEQAGTTLFDGRKIYYKTANNKTDCEGTDHNNMDIIGSLPNVNSVSYLSDGNTLNTTFWLSKKPLINHTWQDKSEQSRISQMFLFTESFNASKFKNKSNATLIEDERENIINRFKFIVNNITNISEPNNKFIGRLFFNGTSENETIFGLRNITGFDWFGMKDDKFFRVLYLAEPRDFRNENNTEIIEEKIDSFQIVGGNGNVKYLRIT
jgi:hypothetical protein